MKKIIKIMLLALVIALGIGTAVISGYAEESDTVPATTAFSVYDKDGNLTEASGDTFAELAKAYTNANDGDTIVLNANIEGSSSLKISSPEDAPRTVNFDLNGYILYATVKYTPAMLRVGDYTTVNFYSSREGGSVYCCNLVGNTSGNVFTVEGKSAVLNVGEFEDGDNVYPGSNISTYSACLIDIVVPSDGGIACDENCRINIKGGSYYSIHTDYSGFIIPRGGKVVMNIEDANIINMESKAPINSAGTETVLNLKNCVMIHYQCDAINLFNNALGTVNMTDCITTYRIYASSSGTASGILNLYGKNVFSVSSDGDYNIDIINGGSALISAKTYTKFELKGGADKFTYYDNSASLEKFTAEVPALAYPAIFANPGDTVKYKFVKGQFNTTETWLKSEQPEFPYDLPLGGEEGVYKYGWNRSVNDDGVIVYTVGYVADYNLKVRAVYENDDLYFKLYVPASIVDDAYIDFYNVAINGEGFAARDWEYEEIDGEGYYFAVTGVIDPLDAEEVISIRVPCDYGKGVYVDTTYSFTVGEYVEAILKTEADALYSEEQYDIIRELQEIYLTKDEEDAEDQVTEE